MGETWVDGSVDDRQQAKWDKGAWQWQRQWHLLNAMNDAFCSLCHWEDLYGMLYTNMQGHAHIYGAAYNALIHQCLVPLTNNNAGYLLLLYASCYCLCQAVTESYAKQDTSINGNTDYIDGFYESSSMINGH